MSFRTRDFMRHGPNAYLTVWDWYSKAENPIAGDDCLTYIFSYSEERIGELFEHLYFPVKEVVYDETEQKYSEETNYYDCGLDFDDILRDFLEIYGERKLYQPYFFEDETGNRRSLIKMANVIQSVIDLNYYKYKKLAATLGFVYDPISNYDMIEQGTDTKTLAGSEELEHEIDATKVTYSELTGPVDPDETTASEEKLDVAFLENKVINTTEKNVSDERAGRYATTTTVNNVDVPGSVSSTPGGTPRTNHYTTTMDSAAESRLAAYDTNAGDTSQSSNTLIGTDFPLIGRKTAGAPGAASYTDTKTFNDREDTNEHTLTRKGNIGVTTSQQMIESERQIVKISLIKEFFEDVNKELLLKVWD